MTIKQVYKRLLQLCGGSHTGYRRSLAEVERRRSTDAGQSDIQVSVHVLCHVTDPGPWTEGYGA